MGFSVKPFEKRVAITPITLLMGFSVKPFEKRVVSKGLFQKA
jgi:hypothetical protein